MESDTIGLVCVGGGRGTRFGGDKLTECVGDRTVLETSLGSLRQVFPDAPMVVVLPRDRLDGWRPILEPRFPGVRLVAGGHRRQDSVRRGVEEIATTGARRVVIHDAARPLVHPADVMSAVNGLGDAAAAILCRPVTDTIKRVDADGAVIETLDRRQLRMAQTPQVIRVEALQRAWATIPDDLEWTDEGALLEAAGETVRTVVAQHPNPKITTVEDLQTVRALQRVAS
jgi:2-C-methyl-D-erythritol 4-phosphate cytidylyltransferase